MAWLASILVLAAGMVGGILLGGGSLRLGSMLHSMAHGDLRALRSELSGLALLAVLALIILARFHTVLPFPAELLEATGGFALGFAVAVPVLLGGFVVSAVLAYLIGMWVGRPVAPRLAGSSRLQKTERLVERAGARGLLPVRSLSARAVQPAVSRLGLAGVPLRRYVWTTARAAPRARAGDLHRLAAAVPQPHADPDLWAPLGAILLLVLAPNLVRLNRARI